MLQVLLLVCIHWVPQIGLVDLEINRLTKILFISMIALAIAMLALKVGVCVCVEGGCMCVCVWRGCVCVCVEGVVCVCMCGGGCVCVSGLCGGLWVCVWGVVCKIVVSHYIRTLFSLVGILCALVCVSVSLYYPLLLHHTNQVVKYCCHDTDVTFPLHTPISLRVNLDMGKMVYSWMIQRDSAIPDTVVRSSTIPEELGRIEFLLSDKTGTLTQNEMVLALSQLCSNLPPPSSLLPLPPLSLFSAQVFRKLHLGSVAFTQESMPEVLTDSVMSYQRMEGVVWIGDIGKCVWIGAIGRCVWIGGIGRCVWIGGIGRCVWMGEDESPEWYGLGLEVVYGLWTCRLWY